MTTLKKLMELYFSRLSSILSTVYQDTVGPHEDIGKFPNCLNSIPNENLGLKKENEQNFFASIYE